MIDYTYLSSFDNVKEQSLFNNYQNTNANLPTNLLFPYGTLFRVAPYHIINVFNVLEPSKEISFFICDKNISLLSCVTKRRIRDISNKRISKINNISNKRRRRRHIDISNKNKGKIRK